MATSLDAPIRERLAGLDVADAEYATRFVDLVLNEARGHRASDVHFQPTDAGLQVRWRLDGVLQEVGVFGFGQKTDVVARLKVLAGLLTYHDDIPQEGRIREPVDAVEMRVSTFPTLYGERAVVRLFASKGQFLYVDDLALPGDVGVEYGRMLQNTSGAILVTGPAGSGKTTSAYAGLRELARASGGGKCLVSLEDPIEVAVEGVAQSQVNSAAGFDLLTGLRSLMRQDPETILIGEIRDRETAEAAIQASLTGHLVLATFHAGSAAEAIHRLLEMSIEPYLVRSGILAIVNQRLVRRLCECSKPAGVDDAKLGLPVSTAKVAVGCPRCCQTGYLGRVVLAELLKMNSAELGRAVLARSDTERLEELAISAGMTTRWQRAFEAIESGVTSPAEVRRVLGFSETGMGTHHE